MFVETKSNLKKMKKYYLVSLLAVGLSLVSCDKDEDNKSVSTVEFKNRSVTPALAKTFSEFSGVDIYTLISSEDVIANSGNMVYGGAPDGQGFIDNPDGSGFIMLNNHENTWAVSRLYLDKKLNITKG